MGTSVTKSKKPAAPKAQVEGETVNLADKVTVYATKNAPFHSYREEITVHPKQAQNFIKKGFAVENLEDLPEEEDEEETETGTEETTGTETVTQ